MKPLVVFLALVSCATTAAADTRCWRLGAEIQCETTQPPAPPVQKGSKGYPLPPNWQPPKVTTCWKMGAEVQCETR